VIRNVCLAMGAYAAAGGVLTLLGWALHVPRLMAWDGQDITMKANTALCAAAGGIALLVVALAPERDAWFDRSRR
jgi:hypothetical protein